MKHEPKSIGAALQTALKQMEAYDNFLKLWVVQNWKKVMMKPLSEICRPIKFENETLIIEAKSEAWANELQKYKKEMIDILNRKFDQLNVTDIKIE
ncbi:DUF721 domain-containing protein [Caldithrix abyssi]